MKSNFFPILAFALASAGSSLAMPVYDNTTTDALVTFFYSTGPYTRIGDTVTLGGTDRLLSDASVQFYNNGAAGTFSATFTLWAVGAPVGSQIGSSFLRSGLSIGAQDSLTVNFTNLNVMVPDELVFTVAISDLSSTSLELGLNAFQPPTVGSSDSTAIILGNASTFSTGSPIQSGQGNLYLRLEATAIPEPATVTTLSVGVAMFGLLAARRRKRAERAAGDV
jgi:hypothetical protein